MSEEQHPLVKFLHARINDSEAPTYKLVPYSCPPGCCAPAGWVGHECLICGDGPTFGGSVEAITQASEDHAENVHRRAHTLAECQAKRRIIHAFPARELWIETTTLGDTEPTYINGGWDIPAVLYILAQPDADHPDFQKEWLL